MAFQYRVRSKEQWEARANQSGGDYEGWIKDEYKLFKTALNENCIRVLPPSPAWDAMCEKGQAPHWGMEVWVHFKVGPDNASVICPYRMKKGRCPVCEERARAEQAKDEERAKDLRAGKRVLTFLINRKEDDQRPVAWGMPYTLDRDIVKASKDRATGKHYFIDDPEAGYDVYFDRTGEGLLTKYSGIVLSKNPSSVPSSAIEWVLDNPVPDALRWRDYDEIKRLFTGVGRGEAPDDRPPPERRSGRSERPAPSERPERSERPEPEPERRAAEEPHNDDPPFDGGKPMNGANGTNGTTAPTDTTTEASADGKSRAEELAAIRARFQPRN